MMARFSVPGLPRGKERSRSRVIGSGKIMQYTPNKTVVYEARVREEYYRQCGGIRFGDDEPLSVVITAYCQMPSSASKKRKQMMRDGEILPVTKPDWDNIGKIVCDALNNVAWRDDSRIVCGTVIKVYSDDPHVEVAVSSWTPKGRGEHDN